MTVDQEAKNLLLREEVIVYFTPGKIHKHYYLIDGKMDGEYKQWYDSGQLFLQCFYKNSELDGEVKIWHEDGTQSVHVLFNNNQLIKDYSNDNRPRS